MAEKNTPDMRRPALGVTGETDAAALAAGGFRVVRFASTADALRAAASGEISHVLLDAAAVRRAGETPGKGVPAAADETLRQLFPALSEQDRALLSLLLRHKGEYVPRREIRRALYGKEQSYETSALDMALSRFRKRLGPFRACLSTKRRMGAKWDDAPVRRKRAARLLAIVAAILGLWLAAVLLLVRPRSGAGRGERLLAERPGAGAAAAPAAELPAAPDPPATP